MSLHYNLARLPIDAAKGAGQLAVWPIHFGKTVVTNVVDTGFKVVGTSTEDEPLAIVNGESIYDMAKLQLDNASMIYYYTELRSEIKVSCKKLAKTNNMTIDDSGDIPSQRVVLEECLCFRQKVEQDSPGSRADRQDGRSQEVSRKRRPARGPF